VSRLARAQTYPARREALYGMAVAAYEAAITARPADKITLRQGARVVLRNWDG
jgi:hypothetical protein